jgi:hypothetical protein
MGRRARQQDSKTAFGEKRARSRARSSPGAPPHLTPHLSHCLCRLFAHTHIHACLPGITAVATACICRRTWHLTASRSRLSFSQDALQHPPPLLRLLSYATPPSAQPATVSSSPRTPRTGLHIPGTREKLTPASGPCDATVVTSTPVWCACIFSLERSASFSVTCLHGTTQIMP